MPDRVPGEKERQKVRTYTKPKKCFVCKGDLLKDGYCFRRSCSLFMGQHITKQPNGKYAIFSSIVDHFIAFDATKEEIFRYYREEAARESDFQTERAFIYAGVYEERHGSRVEEDLDIIARIHGQEEADKMRALLLAAQVEHEKQSELTEGTGGIPE